MKKRLFDIFLGITFISLLISYLFSHFGTSKKKKPARTEITKANDILRKKIILPPDILNTTATSSACTLFLKKSAELSMNEYANEFIDHHVDSILKTCSGAFPTTLQKKIDNALLKCQSSTRENISNECYLSLMEAKTASVAAIIKPDSNPAELDSTVLLHLIANKFSNGDFADQPEQSMKLVDALLDKEPNYLSGYKLKLFLLGVSSLSKDKESDEIFQETMDNAHILNKNDPDLIELELFHSVENFKQDTHHDSKEFLSELDKMAATHKNEWIYDYYKANAIYNNGLGNLAETKALVESALNKHPENLRLRTTLENLNSDDGLKRKYPFSFLINFSLNDL